jgi:GT2 family glycosyltransferase
MTQTSASAISVVIVNYNGGEWIARSVAAALASGAAEVIVSDNGSQDGSLSAIHEIAARDNRVKAIANGANLGFAAGANRALQKLIPESEFVLFLNPDCVMGAETLARMSAAMREHPGAGMAGCLVQNPDGSEQRGSRRRIPTPASALARVLRLDRVFPSWSGFDLAGTPLPDEPQPTEAVSGAFMFVRRSALQAVGPLDEGYFLHCEDLDWFMRFREAGWTILFVPDARATHAQGASSKSAPVRVEWHKHRGMARFYCKFYRRRYPLPLLWLVFAGIWLRFAAKAAWLTLFQRKNR